MNDFLLFVNMLTIMLLRNVALILLRQGCTFYQEKYAARKIKISAQPHLSQLIPYSNVTNLTKFAYFINHNNAAEPYIMRDTFLHNKIGDRAFLCAPYLPMLRSLLSLLRYL